MLTVVVPTYNERDNARTVVTALRDTLASIDFEVLFVDDSRDVESVAILNELASEHSNVRVHHRDDEKGLGTAVVRGFELAKGDVVAVMDADMQHPPAQLVSMLEEIDRGHDIVIPSRFVPGGDDGGLSPFRKFVSWTARMMGQFALKRVRRVTDPTSGFFMMKRSVIDGISLRPVGWKILIEVLVRGRYDSIVEIPYSFQPRAAGTSNMSVREQLNYLHHLLRLVKSSPEDQRLYWFAMVGLSGVVINTLVYIGLVHLHIGLVTSSIGAGFVALLSNFILNDRLTWRDSRSSGTLATRFGKYTMASLAGIGINAGILAVLAYGLHWHYLVANMLGILVAMVWNFVINNFWTWRVKQRNAVTVSLSGTPSRHS